MRRLVPAALAAGFMVLASPSFAVSPDETSVDNAVETHIKRGAPRVTDLDQIQAYVAKHPDDAHGRFVLGELLASGGYQELAEEQFDTISKVNPNYVLDQFHTLMKERSWETALWLGFYVQKHYPQDSGVSFAIGRQWLGKGMQSKANQYFEKALTQKPVWPATYEALGALRFAQARRDEAIKYADMALAIDPSNEDAAALKVASQAEMSGHPELYLVQLEKYAPRNWSNDSTSSMLAQAYINTNQWDKALAPALQALKYSNAARTKLAQDQVITLMHHVQSGKMMAEMDHLSPLNAKDFLSTVLRMRFAKCLSEIGAHKEATKMLLQALQMHSFFAPALNFRLGQEMEAQGNGTDAVYFYKTAWDMRKEEADYKHAYERAKMRYANQDNDLARRWKRSIRKDARS